MADDSLEKKLLRRRHSGFKGNIIPLHHSFTRIRFGASARLAALLLPIIFDFLLWQSTDSIFAFWGDIFRYWTDMLAPGSQITYAQTDLLGHTTLVPFPDLPTVAPSLKGIWTNILAVLIVLLLSLLFPPTIMPFTYFLRASLAIQISSSIFLLLSDRPLPFDLPYYVVQEMTMGYYTLLMIPVLLALIYYIFDFALWRKLVITVAMLAFFLVTLPMQYMLHAYILHAWSMLFLPTLYMLFGVLLDIVTFIAFYAFAMSWQGTRKDDLGRYA